MKGNIFLALLVGVLMLTGCNTIPKDAFVLSETSLQERQLQTRAFKTNDEISILSAGISVLQDMGYSIDEIEKNAGVVTASKTVDATRGSQVFGSILVAALGGRPPPIDKEQKIRVSFVTRRSKMNPDDYLARITFQRVVWNSEGRISRVETIKEEEIYNEYFDKLAKSVFLEANKI